MTDSDKRATGRYVLKASEGGVTMVYDTVNQEFLPNQIYLEVDRKPGATRCRVTLEFFNPPTLGSIDGGE